MNRMTASLSASSLKGTTMRSHFTQRITSRRRALVLLAGLILAATTVSFAVLSTGIAAAAGIHVTNCNDSGPGSLRAVVGAASSGDTVSFALSPSCSTITLTTGLIDVTTSITIKGPGASILAVSGGEHSGVFQVESGATATISGLTIEDSGGSSSVNNLGTLTLKSCTVSNNGDSNIAAVLNESSSTLTVDHCTFSSNGGLASGAISNEGTATVTDSTLSNNAGGVAGGGIANSGTLTVTDSTLSNNGVGAGGFGGGAIYNTGTATVTNSTLSNNTSFVPNGSGAIYAGGGSVTLTKTTLSSNGANFGGVDLAGGTVTATNSNIS
jgi:hypothetical protein